MNNKFYVLGAVLAVGAMLNINNVYGYYQVGVNSSVNVDAGGVKVKTNGNSAGVDVRRGAKVKTGARGVKVNTGNMKVNTENGTKVDVRDGGPSLRVGADGVNVSTNEAVIKLNEANLMKVLKAKVKDAGKRETVIGISGKLNNFNQLISQQYLENLDKMQILLEKTVLRIGVSESKGEDVSIAKQAVSKVKDAIDESRTIVKAQLSKIYSISITGEKSLGVDVMKARQSLRDDMDKARISVVSARDALKIVVSSVAGDGNSGGNVNIGTSSATGGDVNVGR